MAALHQGARRDRPWWRRAALGVVIAPLTLVLLSGVGGAAPAQDTDQAVAPIAPTEQEQEAGASNPALEVSIVASVETVVSGGSVGITAFVTNVGDTDLDNLQITLSGLPGCGDSLFALNPGDPPRRYTCVLDAVTEGFTTAATVTADGPLGPATVQATSEPVTVRVEAPHPPATTPTPEPGPESTVAAGAGTDSGTGTSTSPGSGEVLVRTGSELQVLAVFGFALLLGGAVIVLRTRRVHRA